MDDTENAAPPGADETPPLQRLVFSGKVLPGFEEATVREALSRHLKRAPAELFTGRQVAVSEPLDPVEAEVARQALQALGARVQLEAVEAPPPMAPLSFLEIAEPAAPKEDAGPPPELALTDSGWQALNQALAPLPDAPPDDGALPILPSLRTAAPVPPAPAGEGSSHLFPPGSFPSALSSLPPLPVAPAPLTEKAADAGWQTKPPPASRPPTDLSSVFGSSTPPAPLGEASPVFAPLAKAPLPPPAAAAVLPSASPARDTLPVSGLAMADAAASPAASGIAESALLVNCPNCGERQPMRVLCRACSCDLKRALAAQQEERDQARATRGASGGGASPRAGGKAPVDDGLRILGIRVPEHLEHRFTLANGLLGLFGLLLALAVVGFIWSKFFRPDPVASNPRVAAAAAASPEGAASGEAGQAASANAPRMGPPPSEAEVLARVRVPTAVGEFRLAYWPKATNKVFVASGDNAWAWRAGLPSITRALAEALNECDSRRTPDAPECKVVNINNFWQE